MTTTMGSFGSWKRAELILGLKSCCSVVLKIALDVCTVCNLHDQHGFFFFLDARSLYSFKVHKSKSISSALSVI